MRDWREAVGGAGGGAAGVGRRDVLRMLGAAAACLALPARPLGASAPAHRIRLAVRRSSFSALPLWRAVSGGFFEDAGLTAEVRAVGDENAAALALIRGEADVAVLPTPLFLAVHLGTSGLAPSPHPLATFQVALTDGSTLIVREDSGIEFSRQLEGKTIGVATPWGMPKLLTEIYLLQSGLKPGEDTGWEVLAPAEMGQALRSGRVDALAAEEWLPADLVGRAEARALVSLRRLWPEHPAEVVAVSRRFAEEAPDLLARVALASLRVAKTEGAGEDEPASASFAAWAGADAARAAQAHRSSGAGHYPFPFRNTVRIVLEELKKRRLAPPNLDHAQVVAAATLTGLCRDAMAQAGFAEIPRENSRPERLGWCCTTH